MTSWLLSFCVASTIWGQQGGGGGGGGGGEVRGMAMKAWSIISITEMGVCICRCVHAGALSASALQWHGHEETAGILVRGRAYFD